MKIDEVRKLYARQLKDGQDKAEQIRAIIAELEQLQKDAESAAMDGNSELYKEIRSKIDSKSADLFVLRKSAARCTVTAETTRDAWLEYSKQYATNFKKKAEALDKAKLELRDAYENAMRCQNGALAIREELAGMTGEDPAEYVLPAELPNTPGLPVPNSRAVAPEYRYMYATGLWPSNDLIHEPARDACDNITVQHRHVAEPKFS